MQRYIHKRAGNGLLVILPRPYTGLKSATKNSTLHNLKIFKLSSPLNLLQTYNSLFIRCILSLTLFIVKYNSVLQALALKKTRRIK